MNRIDLEVGDENVASESSDTAVEVEGGPSSPEPEEAEAEDPPATAVTEMTGDILGKGDNASLPEQLNDREEPLPQVAIITGARDESQESDASKGVEAVQTSMEDGSPTPFNSAQFEDSIEKKMIKLTMESNRDDKRAASESMRNDVQTRLDHVRDIPLTMDEEEELSVGIVRYSRDQLQRRMPQANENNDIYVRESNNLIRNANDAEAVEREQKDPIIVPEAFLVENGDDGLVVSGTAEVLLPFWKRRSTKIFLCLIFTQTIAFIITLVILFAGRTSDSQVTVVIGAPIPGNNQTSPTSLPTLEYDPGKNYAPLPVEDDASTSPDLVLVIVISGFGSLLCLTCTAFGYFSMKRSQQGPTLNS